MSISIRSIYHKLSIICKLIRNSSQENELIFDAQGISFKSIIDHMQVFKEKQCLFKIQPKNSSYVIGSSSADTKGEVIQF